MSGLDKILTLKDVTVNLGGNNIIEDISFSVSLQDWLMLIGPNGAGKSTCVYTMARSVAYLGSINLEDKSIFDYSNIEYAKKVGFLSQKNLVTYDFSVEEVVAMGRYCHQSGFIRNLSKADKEHINKALKITGTYEFKDRSVQELSGGEVQRTFLAQVLAQDPQVLVLDEPTNNLDLLYQSQIFELIKSWIKNTGGTVISVVHDLGLAKAFGSKAVLLSEGKLVQDGPIDDVLSSKNLNEVYKIDVGQYMNKLYSDFIL